MKIDPDELRAKGIAITPELLRSLRQQTAEEYGLTENEFKTIRDISTDLDFLKSMSQLKKDDIIEFNLKMSQFKSTLNESTANIPKCPTCGSTDIKKISGTKRWVGTGLFGLASSDVGKTMKCNNCGYKF